MRTISVVRTALLLSVAAAGCVQPPARPTVAPLSPLPDDPHSFARPAEARVTHVSLDLTPDFSARRLSGTARLTVARAPGADSVILDVRDLTIKRVTDAGGNALGFNVGAAQGFLGAPLAVALPASGDIVAIEYETSPGAAAVQWLSPEQTSGKKLPFMFTQGQAILTRTWIPTQDGPGIRQTYDAVIRVPAGMRAVMSAAQAGTAGERDAEGRAVYRFTMDKRIPPYLFALAVGDIAFRRIGPRTGVYAEPAVVDRAAAEFVEVDRMIETAERLYGPYRWGRYDILVLPPSFPFGGMENPTLTFATPTILAGDRSLVSLIAHELAHSWSGNLVTNATWDDFWLNEGFTTYIEKRLMEALRGKPYADMLRELGRREMHAAVQEVGGPQAADSRLRIDLRGRDPDEGFTDIAYEKGAAFLETVESVVGRDRLDAFLRDYFDRFALQPMTSEIMLAYMREKLFRPGEEERINPTAWIYQPGIPSNVPIVRSEAFAAVDAQIQKWNAGASAAALSTANWSTQEWLHFLHALPDTIPAARLADLDATFRFSSSGNSEVLFAWLQKAIANRYTAAFPALENFLTSMGRRKFLAPLYTDLAKTEWGRAMAMDIYRRARPTYHPVSVGSVDTILKWNQN